MDAAARPPIAFALHGPIARADLRTLCERISALLAETRAEMVVCDVRGAKADAVTVDALARLQLAAGRHGSRLCLRGAPPDLLDLVSFVGLGDVLSE